MGQLKDNGIFTAEELKLLKDSMGKGKVSKYSGVRRVSKNKSTTHVHGYVWRYRFTVNGKGKSISHATLKGLRKRVKSRGLPWDILNKNIYEKALEEDECCQRKFLNLS